MYVHPFICARELEVLIGSQPWLLSNIVDETTSKVPEHLKEYEIFERGGVRIGVIGLIEQCGNHGY